MSEFLSERARAEHQSQPAEYVRELIARDQEEQRTLADVRATLEASRASGTSPRNVLDIMERVEAEMRRDGVL